MYAGVGKRKVIESENGAAKGQQRVALHLGQGIKGIWKAVHPICVSGRKVKGPVPSVCDVHLFTRLIRQNKLFSPKNKFLNHLNGLWRP